MKREVTFDVMMVHLLVLPPINVVEVTEAVTLTAPGIKRFLHLCHKSSCVLQGHGHGHMGDSCHHGHAGPSHCHGPRAAHPFMAAFQGQFGKSANQVNLREQPKKRSHMEDSSSWDIVKAAQ